MADEKEDKNSQQTTDDKQEEKGEKKGAPKEDPVTTKDSSTEESTSNGAGDTADSEDTEEVEVPEKFKKLVEEIEGMSVLELNELVRVLEKKFGVSAVAVAAGPAAGAEGGAEEKDSYNIELTAMGDNKIAVIKAVKEVSGLGLKEAKDLVEGAPGIIKEGVKKEEAEEIKAKLEEAGAKVELK